MSQAALILNISDQAHSHSNGLSGSWTVPAKKPDELFALLVVYPTPEIQDIGDGRRITHWLKALPLAKDIVGLRSDAAAHSLGAPGTKEKWGLLLCEAEPDLPKDLLTALEEEMAFLNANPPDVKMRMHPESGALVATNIESVEVRDRKIELSERAQTCRTAFEQECRKLVTKREIEKAKRTKLIEDQRLVAEGDNMWARPNERTNINATHLRACADLGQERPWAYQPKQLVPCPGCASMIAENVLSCAHCGGWLDEGIEVLRAMAPKQRAQKMYPERYSAEPMPVGGQKR